MRIHKGQIATAVAGCVAAMTLCAVPQVSLANFRHIEQVQTIPTATAPEPGTLALALLGGAGLLGVELRRRRRSSKRDSERK